MVIDIKIGKYSELGKDARDIRNSVFCQEQKIDIAIERDEHDLTATFVVIYDENRPVATGRIILKDNQYIIGRIATLKTYRGRGLGKLVVVSLLDWAFKNNVSEVIVHAQKHAEEFYKKIGFSSFGYSYFEAGKEHINMTIKNNYNNY